MKPQYAIIGVVVVLIVLTIPVIMNRNRTEGPMISYSVYEQIQLTQTYDQVVNIVGRPGIETDLPPEKAMELRGLYGRVFGAMRNQGWEVYGWKNSKSSARGDSPRMFVMFVNGKVVAKYQVGLE